MALYNIIIVTLFLVKDDTTIAYRLVIDDSDKQKRILSSIHGDNHLGIHRTNDLISKKYYWPGLYKDITIYVSAFYHGYL